MRRSLGVLLLCATAAAPACAGDAGSGPARPGGSAAPAPEAREPAGGGVTGSGPRAAPSAPQSTTAAPSAATARERSAPGLAAPGRYSYAVTGVLRSSLGERPLTDELVLEVAEAAGGEQRSVLQGDEGTVEQVLRSGVAGLEVTYLRLDRAPVRVELRPAPPVLALPHGAAEGRTWSWAATSTDGSVTVTSQFHAVRREAVAVGGRTVPSLVVEATVTTTGAFEATSRQTRWVSEERGLVLRQHDVTDGRYQAFTFHSETEQVLQQLEPA